GEREVDRAFELGAVEISFVAEGRERQRHGTLEVGAGRARLQLEIAAELIAAIDGAMLGLKLRVWKRREEHGVFEGCAAQVDAVMKGRASEVDHSLEDDVPCDEWLVEGTGCALDCSRHRAGEDERRCHLVEPQGLSRLELRGGGGSADRGERSRLRWS